jgi:hypothetical protein
MSLGTIVESLKAQAEKFGEKLEPPASRDELSNVEERAKVEFGIALPEEYLDFLRLADGLELNGLVVYGTKNSAIDPDGSQLDVLEMNRIARESRRAELSDNFIVGETSTGLLTFGRTNGSFQYRDRIGIDRVIEFSSFEEMLIAEIAKVL